MISHRDNTWDVPSLMLVLLICLTKATINWNTELAMQDCLFILQAPRSGA
jgi:hypothetical protein